MSELRTFRIGQCLLGLLLSVFLGSPRTTYAQQNASDAGLYAHDPLVLVRLLGSDSFWKRNSAESALRKDRTVARTALRVGLQSGNLQTRRSCRRLLDVIGGIDQDRQLAFIKGDQEFDAVDLPSWPQFELAVGNDVATRTLYISMLRAEPGLLNSFALDPASAATAMQIRCKQLPVRAGIGRSQPSLPSLAALLLVGSDHSSRPSQPAGYGLRSMLSQLLPGKGDRNRVVRPSDDPFIRLLGHFIAMETDEAIIPTCFQLALALPVKDSALRLALHIIETRNGYRPQTVAMAADAVGLFGGDNYLTALVPLLDDDRTCGGLRGQNVPVVEIRDVAAAWIVRLSRQNAVYYGIRSEDYFRRIAKLQGVHTLGRQDHPLFKDRNSRAECFRKLRAWLVDHPPKPFTLRLLRPSSGGVIRAQKPRTEGSEVGEDADACFAWSITMPDYLRIRQLRTARGLIADHRFAEGTAILGKILADREDSVFTSERYRWRSLRSVAEETLASLSAAGLDAYQRQFGAEAQRQLDAAVETRDGSLLAEVQNRFFYTPAGAQAALLQALQYLDLDQPEMASLYLRRLANRSRTQQDLLASVWFFQAICSLRSGNADVARAALDTWKQHEHRASIEIGGRQVPVFSADEEPIAWLRRVLGFRGGGSGPMPIWSGEVNVQSRGNADTILPKTIDVAGGNPFLARLRDAVVADRRGQGLAAMSTVDALQIGDLLVQRVFTGIVAVKRVGGGLVWRVPAENAMTYALHYGSPVDGQRLLEPIKAGMRHRLWRDVSWGAISSDGVRVFALEDLAFDLSLHYEHIVTRLDGRRQWDFGSCPGPNLLSAYDARTGKILWQVGTAFGETTPGFVGARILGPPLPIGGQLFVLVDFPVQTRLVQLSARDGKVAQQWSLEPTDRPVLAGRYPPPALPPVEIAPPVFSGDLIICPTSRDRFVALDPCVGMVWGFQVDSQPPARKSSRKRGRTCKANSTWLRAEAVVSGDRVLVTAPGDNHLHCLEVRTGKRLWKAPRHDGLVVASVLHDRAIIVENSRVRCVDLSDGQSAWPKDHGVLPEGAVPLHHGWATASSYMLPLSSGRLAAIELSTGTVRLSNGQHQQKVIHNVLSRK